jgi:phosphatidylserine/phosphatidylglycerophosphate/cardiolipin synthase-like enzyme
VDEIVECFDADWNRDQFDPGEDSHLVWCNINGRNRVARFIDAAEESLFLQNERYQDEVIIERLVRATRRGVKLHVLARPAHFLKKGKLVEGVEGLRILQDLGAKVHRLKGLKLHAKLMLADGKHVIIGSINLAPGSFDSRRELAIEVHDESVVKRVREVVLTRTGRTRIHSISRMKGCSRICRKTNPTWPRCWLSTTRSGPGGSGGSPRNHLDGTITGLAAPAAHRPRPDCFPESVG